MSDLFYNKGQFTVMIIVGRVERAVNSKAVNFRFQPKPAYLAVDYKTELKLDYYHANVANSAFPLFAGKLEPPVIMIYIDYYGSIHNCLKK